MNAVDQGRQEVAYYINNYDYYHYDYQFIQIIIILIINSKSG